MENTDYCLSAVDGSHSSDGYQGQSGDLADMPKWDGIVAVYTAVTAAIDIIGH